MKPYRISYYILAQKEILEQKVVSFLILTAVVLSTMMTTAVGQSAGVLTAMRRQQAVMLRGDYHATFVQLNEEKTRMLEADERFSYTGRSVPVGSTELNDLLRLDLVEYQGKSIETIPAHTKLVEGRLPAAPMEIALSEDALKFLGFDGKTGDRISLSLSKALRHGVAIEAYDYQADFILTGITESNYLGYVAGALMGLVGEGTAEEVLPPEYFYYSVDVRVKDPGHFQDCMDDIAEKLEIHELDTIYNQLYLNALGIRYRGEHDHADLADGMDDTGFSYMMLAGVVVTGLVLTAAGLVIYNILKIAVTRRMGRYGILRAIGAQKRQLYGIVAAEVLLLCALGIPIGMLLGRLSAKGILEAALSQLSPELFLVQDAVRLQELIAANDSGKWGFLALSALITLVSAFLAAAPAARYAARVSPVMAMHGMTGRNFKRRSRKMRTIRNFERYYAGLNLWRNKSRTVITVLSLVMSITVFITLQGVLALVDLSGRVPEHLGDYSVVNEYAGFTEDEMNDLAADRNVAAVAAQQFSIYELDEQYRPVGIDTDFALGIGERFQIFGLNDAWMEDVFAGQLSKEAWNALQAGEGCVVRNPLQMEVAGQKIGTTCIEEGSTIVVAGKKLQVLLAMNGYDGYFSVGSSGFINGVQVIVSDRLYPELTGTDRYAELRPILEKGADREAFEEKLSALGSRVAGTTWVSYEQTDRQLAESAGQIRLLAWGMILLIGMIGILNIINTVYTNIHTRVTEIGIKRAIGMSVGSLYRTFLWEGAYYGMIAAVTGSITGYLSTMLMEAAMSNVLTLVPVPVIPILESAVVSVAACLAATALPLRQISRLGIVEAVGAVE